MPKKIATLFLLLFLTGATPALAFSVPGDGILSHFLSNGTEETSARGEVEVRVAPTPIPGAVWLLGTGLVGLVGLRRKYRS